MPKIRLSIDCHYTKYPYESTSHKLTMMLSGLNHVFPMFLQKLRVFRRGVDRFGKDRFNRSPSVREVSLLKKGFIGSLYRHLGI